MNLSLRIGSELTLDSEGTAAKVVLAVEDVIVILAYDRDDRRAGYRDQRGIQSLTTGYDRTTSLTLHREIERALFKWEEVRVG
jgi:hypothetical protein